MNDRLFHVRLAYDALQHTENAT